MTIALYLIIGIVAGFLAGTFGIGGGVVMVPSLVFLFGLSQHQAQGTSLAVMALGIFILPAWRYYAAGNVKIQMAVMITFGFIFGSLIGSHLVQGIPETSLKKYFGILLVAIGCKMIFFK